SGLPGQSKGTAKAPTMPGAEAECAPCARTFAEGLAEAGKLVIPATYRCPMPLDIPRLDGRFEVVSDYQPAGDQPTAIADLERRVRRGDRHSVLLGATGTGKSATTAWLVERLQRPTLVLAPNKTLCAQLAKEFRELLPRNA